MSERSITKGDVVAGRYRVERERAGGGRGVVYVAEHVATEQRVALKVLFADPAESEEALERFQLEARVFGRLASDHIVRVLDAGLDAERSVAFIAMELLEGETFQKLVERRGRLDAATLVGLLSQVAEALDRAHAHLDTKGARSPIVHRDLKPANIFVTPRGDGMGHATVLDFGVAKLASATTQVSTEIRGTPQYMAFEQLEGEAVSPATDVAALGLIAFFGITGKSYWKTANDPAGHLATLLREILAGTKTAASTRAKELQLDVELSASFDEWFARATATDPTKRFSSAGAAVQALARSLGVTNAALGVPMLGVTGDRASAPAAVERGALVFRARAWMILVPAALVVIAVLAIPRSRPAVAPAAPDAAAADSGAPAVVHGIAMTAYPPPRTANPAAAAAYAAGLSSVRDGAIGLGFYSFVRAAKLDPTMAAAQLRVALYASYFFGALSFQQREAQTAAVRFRASLDERDASLLPSATAGVADPPDWKGARDGLEKAALRFPLDAEVQYLLATALAPLDDRQADFRAASQRARILDPEFAAPLVLDAVTEFEFRRDEAALSITQRCLTLSPAASTCLRVQADIHEALGDCAAVEADARHLLQIEPSSPLSYELLGRALAGRGAPIESVRLALDRMVELGSDVSLFYRPSVARYWLTTLVGDLAGAETALRETEQALAAETSGAIHEWIARELVDIALERGESAETAQRSYAKAERLAAARLSDAPDGLGTERLYAAHAAHKVDDAELERQRARRYHEMGVLQPALRGSVDDDRSWTSIYVEHAKTPDEISDTLARLESRGGFHDEWGYNGRLFLAAGRADDAVAVLRPAAKRCGVIPEMGWPLAHTTLWWMNTNLQLATAYEAKGNTADACATYAIILDRWKDARPRSLTLEKAKARSRALRCTAR